MLFVLIWTAASMFAQSADFITALLEADSVTAGQVCYLVATGMGLADEEASEEDALNALERARIAKVGWTADAGVTYAEAAGLLIRFWDVNTGLFYRITKSDRYAFRQLKVDGVVPQNADPSFRPSGTDVLNMYTAGDDLYGGGADAKDGEG